jgi:hypothetical protein
MWKPCLVVRGRAAHGGGGTVVEVELHVLHWHRITPATLDASLDGAGRWM